MLSAWLARKANGSAVGRQHVESLAMSVTFEQAREQAAREVALTERWTPLKPHKMQSLLMYHPARFKWVPAGRRSGKTETAKRDSVMQLIVDDGTGPARLLIGAPTYTRVKDIYFEDLRALIPKTWIKRTKESTSEIEFRTHWDASIRLVGMNKPQVVEGVPWRNAKFDEMADYPKGCFERHILPALSTDGKEGSAWMYGVPDEAGGNQTEYEKYWDKGLQWPKHKEHCSFWWPSSDILSAERIRELSETMDPSTYRQEMLGQFVRSGNRAFPVFSPTLHVSAHYAEYSPFLPLCYSLDFGVQPAASLIAQHYKNQIWILDEIILGDGSTDVAATTFVERTQERGYDKSNGLHIYGDAAGRTPSSSVGQSDYEIVRQYLRAAGFNPQFRNLVSNPLVKDTVNAIRGKLTDYRGVVSIWIHPRCERLIEELKSAPWPDKLKTFHALAALRYIVYALFGDRGSAVGVTGFGRADLTENEIVSAKYTR